MFCAVCHHEKEEQRQVNWYVFASSEMIYTYQRDHMESWSPLARAQGI